MYTLYFKTNGYCFEETFRHTQSIRKINIIKGQLTKEKIIKFQNYYERATMDNADDVEIMKKRLFAILVRMSSSNDAAKHVY